MSEQSPGFLEQVRSFPRQFWVANTMEIFERMSWYGWFTVMALYVTGSKETGGLGFDTETRGALQGIVPFFLYMFPVFTGALADRFGFRRTFIWAYLIMILAYSLLGQFSAFPTFFMAFMFVAVGAALFKPVVVGTVAKVTSSENSSMGFGIFYMMVNIGGFVGPIVAGAMRGIGWNWVFVACSAWAGVNLLIVLLFYKEPDYEESQRQGGFAKILDNMVEVLGNARFFLTVFGVLFALMFANLKVGIFEAFTWEVCWIAIPAWLLLNVAWDRLMPAGSGEAGSGRPALLQRMRCSNWRFALFLLIMSGFWTAFNQIFLTMPEYIRDFIETRPLTDLVASVDPGRAMIVGGVLAVLWGLYVLVRKLERGYLVLALVPIVVLGLLSLVAQIGKLNAESTATVNELEYEKIVRSFTAFSEGDWDAAKTSHELIGSKVRRTPVELEAIAAGHPGDPTAMADAAIEDGRQFNPEFVINVDALAIVLFQVLVSFVMARFHRFTTMIVGMVIAAVGIGLSAFAGGGIAGPGGSIWIVVSGILIFAFGEMMASPTSQEYVGRIAPAEKKALYMGYYFVAISLGNLFGGILSGELYGRFARDMGRPDIMWGIFGAIMLFTAMIFVLYDKFALPRKGGGTVTGH